VDWPRVGRDVENVGWCRCLPGFARCRRATRDASPISSSCGPESLGADRGWFVPKRDQQVRRSLDERRGSQTRTRGRRTGAGPTVRSISASIRREDPDQAAGASRVNVTQWMSTVTVSDGSASKSSHRFPALIARSSPAVEAGALGPNSRDHDRAGTGGASYAHGTADAASDTSSTSRRRRRIDRQRATRSHSTSAVGGEPCRGSAIPACAIGPGERSVSLPVGAAAASNGKRARRAQA
jgi:hypothetical protein